MRLILLAALISGLSAAANPARQKGFDHFHNLEYDQALVVFRQLAARNPDDPLAHAHVAQTLLYKAMFKAGALESELVSGNKFSIARSKIVPSEADQKAFDDAIAKAIEICERRLAKDPQDVDALYALGAAHSLQSNYNFLVRKQWRDALREFTEARKLHDRVLELRPGFVDAELIEGVHDYIVGSLPWGWKMLGFLFGFRGDKEGGLRKVEHVAKHGNNNRVDAMILLAVAYRRERQAEKAVPLLHELIEMFPRNYLFRLEMVQMYADLGKKDEALAVLKTMSDLKASGAPGYKNLPGGKIHYSRGNLLFWYREYPAAVAELQRAIALGESAGLVTLTNAWLRLGQSFDMLKNRSEAVRAYNEAIRLSPDSDAAKEAGKYLRSPYKR